MARDDRRQGAEDRPSAPDLHRCARRRLRADRSALIAWRLTVRAGPRTARTRFERLGQALEAVAVQADDLARGAERRPVDVKITRFEPSQQVVARLELTGPGRVHAGLDVRGDGSTEVFTGRIRRRPVERRRGESAAAALRRVLEA